MLLLPDLKYLGFLNMLQAQPQLSRRELERTTGLSQGKVNYWMKTLMGKGLVKLATFAESLTITNMPTHLLRKGCKKNRMTLSFLNPKLSEYGALKKDSKHPSVSS